MSDSQLLVTIVSKINKLNALITQHDLLFREIENSMLQIAIKQQKQINQEIAIKNIITKLDNLEKRIIDIEQSISDFKKFKTLIKTNLRLF